MQENIALVQNGFRILLPDMAGYICRELSRVYKNSWWQEVLTALSDQYDLPSSGEYAELQDSLDVANCLRLIDRRWNDVFRSKLSKDYRTWATELMGVRNKVAHLGMQDIAQADAERALDTMARLCDGFDSDELKKFVLCIVSSAMVQKMLLHLPPRQKKPHRLENLRLSQLCWDVTSEKISPAGAMLCSHTRM